MFKNKNTQVMLERLSVRLKEMLEKYDEGVEYKTTIQLLNTIVSILDNKRLIDEIDIDPVEPQDYISESHFNSLFSQTEKSLLRIAELGESLADEFNEELVQMVNFSNATAKVNEVTNTKVDEIAEQIAKKFKNTSINDEQWIKLDFEKNPIGRNYDTVNNVLMMKKETSLRMTRDSLVTATINNTAFDYSSISGATGGLIIDNYLVKELQYNQNTSLFDSVITTNFVVQSIDEKPRVTFNIDTSPDSFLFNLISVFTNDVSDLTIDGKPVPGNRNTYVFSPSLDAIVNVNSSRRPEDKYVPIIRLIDNTTGETVQDLTYFQTMKLLDNETFETIITNEEEMLKETFEFEELETKTTQTIIDKHYKINEVVINDLLIEANTYSSKSMWESDIIETGKDIIAVELFSDYMLPPECTLRFLVKIGNEENYHEIDAFSINQERKDNIFLPNRLVLDPSAVTASDGDEAILPMDEKQYLRLKVEMETTDQKLTPLVYDLKLRIKVQR